MIQNPSMRMDNLFYSLKELQNEKVCLEQKLHEQKRTRHSLEQELEQVTSKYSHIQEKHMRMSETLAVAQQKVEQSMKTFMSLQAEIERNRPKVREAKEEIEWERNAQCQLLTDFQNTLANISSQLFHAKRFYKKDLLMKEIQNTEQELQSVEQRVEKTKNEIKHLNNRLEKLDRELVSGRSQFGVERTLAVCCCAMDRDEEEANGYLGKVREELETVHLALKNAQ